MDELQKDHGSDPCPVGVIVFNRYRPGVETKLGAISRGSAALELGRNILNIHLFGSQALPTVAELVRRADCYSLLSGSLNDAVTAVRHIVATRKQP